MNVTSGDDALGLAATSAVSRFFFPTRHHGQTMSLTTSMVMTFDAAAAAEDIVRVRAARTSGARARRDVVVEEDAERRPRARRVWREE